MLLARLPQGFLIRPPTLDDAEAIVTLLTTDANTVEYLGYSISSLLDHWQTPGFTKETDAWVVVSPAGRECIRRGSIIHIRKKSVS